MSSGGSSNVIDAFQRARLCVRCNTHFNERNNLGLWRCPAYHPLGALASPHTHRLACCGQAPGEPGCVRADHTDKLHEDGAVMMITRDDASVLGIERVRLPSTWTRDREGNYLVQRRDQEEHYYRTTARDPPDRPENRQLQLRCERVW